MDYFLHINLIKALCTRNAYSISDLCSIFDASERPHQLFAECTHMRSLARQEARWNHRTGWHSFYFSINIIWSKTNTLFTVVRNNSSSVWMPTDFEAVFINGCSKYLKRSNIIRVGLLPPFLSIFIVNYIDSKSWLSLHIFSICIII